MRIMDWISDVCSSDLDKDSRLLLRAASAVPAQRQQARLARRSLRNPKQRAHAQLRHLRLIQHGDLNAQVAKRLAPLDKALGVKDVRRFGHQFARELHPIGKRRSEEHTSELQSLMRISYAVFCLKKKTNNKNKNKNRMKL